MLKNGVDHLEAKEDFHLKDIPGSRLYSLEQDNKIELEIPEYHFFTDCSLGDNVEPYYNVDEELSYFFMDCSSINFPVKKLFTFGKKEGKWQKVSEKFIKSDSDFPDLGDWNSYKFRLLNESDLDTDLIKIRDEIIKESRHSTSNIADVYKIKTLSPDEHLFSDDEKNDW